VARDEARGAGPPGPPSSPATPAADIDAGPLGKRPVPDATHIADTQRPVVSAWLLALIVAALLMLLFMAGVPGEEHRAGDGSEKLRHGWARKQAEAAERAAAQPAPGDAPAR
jgi:hypothetical protein